MQDEDEKYWKKYSDKYEIQDIFAIESFDFSCLCITGSGPNSFGKTKLGFVDSKKIFEKKMQQMLNNMGE